MVSLTVPEETPEEVTTCVAPTQPSTQEPPLVFMLPDGAITEETQMVTHGVRGDVPNSENIEGVSFIKRRM